jgi:hypothetical protein
MVNLAADGTPQKSEAHPLPTLLEPVPLYLTNFLRMRGKHCHFTTL